MEKTVEENLTIKPSPFEKRVHEIDLIRGILIIIVFIDHLINNFMLHSATWYQITGNEFWNNFSNGLIFYWNHPARVIVRIVILSLFCLISGISCAFSKNNWKRAGKALVLAGIIAVGSNLLQTTGWAGQNVRVDFNIIAVIGCSTLFYCFFQDKSNKALIIGTICLFAFSFTVVPLLYNFFPGAKESFVPALWSPPFPVGDWMPLFPYIGFFFGGAIISRYVYKDKTSKFKRHEWERPVCFLGRHTLIIYLTHYVVLAGIFAAVDAIVRAVCH